MVPRNSVVSVDCCCWFVAVVVGVQFAFTVVVSGLEIVLTLQFT